MYLESVAAVGASRFEFLEESLWDWRQLRKERVSHPLMHHRGPNRQNCSPLENHTPLAWLPRDRILAVQLLVAVLVEIGVHGRLVLRLVVWVHFPVVSQ